jgi:hypothetical protein
MNPDYAIANPPQGVVKLVPKPVPMNAIAKPAQEVVKPVPRPVPMIRPQRPVVIRPVQPAFLRISQ